MDHGDGGELKVGELARATGLTVRTLHHWGERGLVVPSRRTAAGHRLYGAADVRRVYEVLALRELGLSLEAVAGVLAPGADRLEGILSAHLDQVEQRVRALTALHMTLSSVVARLRQQSAVPGTADLLALINEVTRMSETFRSYFTDEQLAAIEQRGMGGTIEVDGAQVGWPELFAAVRSEMDAGTDPAEPRVQALAAQWMTLLESFDGGDLGMRDALYRMVADHGEEIAASGGPSLEMITYVSRASACLIASVTEGRAETLRGYVTDEQLESIERRRGSTGLQAAWLELFGAVRSEMDAGTDPSDPWVQALAARWRELMESSDATRSAILRVYDDHAEEIAAAGGPSREMIDYVRRAGEAFP